MSSWGNYDNAANAPYWAVNSTIVNATDVKENAAAPTAANVALLYANTTANVYTSRETIGLFGVDTQEAKVNGKVAHAGWVLKTTGQGGRAGRVQQETLIALSSMNGTTGDGDAQVYANVSISLTQPGTKSVVSGSANANTVTFTVTPTLTGNTAAALTYKWQVNNNTGGTWVDVANGNNPQPGGVQKAGATTNTLSITPWNSSANNYVFRAIVTAADEGVSATSANATILIS
jgi:hypothetical protein